MILSLRCQLALAVALASTATARAETAENDARAVARRLPGFAKLAGAAVRSTGDHQFELALAKRDITATVFGVDGTWLGAITHRAPAAIAPRDLDPRFEAVVGAPSLSHLSIVVAERAGDFALARLPAGLALAPYGMNGTLHLEPGVNVFATAAPGVRGVLGRLATGAGFHGEVRIQGVLAASVAGSLLGTGPASGGATSLMVTFPAFSPEPFASLADRSAFSLEVRELALAIRAASGDLDVGGTIRSQVTIAGRPTTIDGTLAVTRRAGAAYDVAVTGKAATSGVGLGGLTLAAIGLRFDGATHASSLGIVADVVLPNRRTVTGAVTLELAKINGRTQLEEVALSLTGEMTLADLGINVPAARDLALVDPSLGMRVASREGFVGGTLRWRARGLETTGVVYLRGGARPAAALFARLHATRLSSLVPGLPGAADLELPDAVMILSSAPLADVPVSSLPSPARQMLAQVAIDASGRITATDGVTLLARLGGSLVTTANALGISGPIVVAGSIGGVVSGSPGFSLYADLPGIKLPSALANVLHARSVKPRLFVALSRGDLGAQLDLGLELEAAVRFGKQEPVFAGRLFTSIGAKGPSTSFTGKLVGRWAEPFGLTGIAFEDVVVGLGLGASASVDVALAGKVAVGALRYEMTGFTTLQAAGIPVPRALGIAIRGNKAGLATPFVVGDALVGAAVTGPLGDALPAPLKATLAVAARVGLTRNITAALPIDMLELRDFELYLATPGASHPDLPAFDGMGVRIRGKLYLNDQLLGQTDSALKMPEGLVLDVAIARLALGPLSLDKARLHLAAAIPGPSSPAPSLEISGKAGVAPFDVGVQVKIDRTTARFTGAVNLGPLGGAALSASSIGSSVVPKDFSLSVAVRGFDKGFAQELGKGIKALLGASATAKAIRAADALVAQRTNELANARAAAKRDFDAAMRDLTKAQHEVDKLGAEIRRTETALNAARRSFDHAAAFPPNPGNMARYGAQVTALGTKLGTLVAAHGTARGTLELVKQGVKAVPVESNPKVVAAAAALGAAQTARGALEAKRLAENAIAVAATQLVEGATSAFSIQRIELVDARLSKLVTGEKQKLRVAMTVAGKHLDHTFEVDLRGPWRLDFAQLAKDVVARF